MLYFQGLFYFGSLLLLSYHYSQLIQDIYKTRLVYLSNVSYNIAYIALCPFPLIATSSVNFSPQFVLTVTGYEYHRSPYC